MYPLKVVLIGCPEELVPEVLGELFQLDARVTTRYPDIAAAVSRPSSVVAWTDGAVRPSHTQVFVVRLRTRDDAKAIGCLQRTYHGSPVVALVDFEDDGLSALALGQGAAQVVPLPLPPGELRAALEDVARPFAAPDGPPRVIAVAGAAGGCGATTLAVNLAAEFADLGLGRCVLIELTHRMGVVADFLNVTPEITVRELAAETGRLDAYRVERALTPAGDNLAVLAGPPAAACRRPAPVRDLLRIVELARGLAGVVVLDVPGTHDDLYYGALGAADRAVLVGEQRVPTVRAWQVVVKAVVAQAPSRKPALVVNRFDPRAEGFGIQDLTRVLGRSAPHTIADDPRAVAGAINRGVPVRAHAPGSAVAIDIAALARSLADRDGAQAPPPGGSGVVAGGSSIIRLFQTLRGG